MAYYRCGGGSSVELPSLYQNTSYSSTNFNVKDYIAKIDAGKSLAIPVGSQNDFICIKVSSAGLVTATPLVSSNTVKPVSSTEVTIQAAQTAIVTYGFRIVKLVYIDAYTILLLYNWQTDANKLSITYSKVLSNIESKIYQSNADSTFAVSLVNPGSGIAGSAFVGKIFKAENPYGNACKLGIVYGNRQYSASTLSKTNVHHGFIATYITTSASYVQIAKTIASVQSITKGIEDICETKSSYYKNAVLGSGYTLRESGTNVAGVQQFVPCTNPYSYYPNEICLGKLSDGNYVFLDESQSKINIYGIVVYSTGSSISKIVELSINSVVSSTASLLKGDILLYQDSSNTSHLKQVIFKDGAYTLLDLGTVDVTYNPNQTKTINGATILNIPRFGGFLSDTYSMIGNRMDPNYGTLSVSTLSVARSNLAATSIGSYALFGGGGSDTSLNVVDAYNTSLTRSTPTALSTARVGLAATTVGNYALFGGGYYFTSSNNYYSNVVDAYNTFLTRSTPTALSVTRYYLAATSIGNYALFGGGGVSYTNFYDVVDAYNTSLTRSTPTVLSVARRELAATSIGNYALFGGGYGSSYFNVVDAYNTSLTRSTPTALSVARSNLAATSIGSYALFGGGSASNVSNVVDAYNTSLTRSTPSNALSVARYQLAATSIGNYALFGGGSTGSVSNVVDAYNTFLTRSTPTTLSAACWGLTATTVGNYALFGGGQPTDYYSNVVDAYYA